MTDRQDDRCILYPRCQCHGAKGRFDVACFRGRRILCVGDVMLDRYVHGSVDRVSPEAPVPVFKVEYGKDESRLGGAGTVVRNIAALGGEAVFVTAVGADRDGDCILELIGKLNGVTPHVVPEKGRITTVKTRYISGNHQVSRTDCETNAPLHARTATRLLDAVNDAMPTCSAVTLSDYGKGVLTEEVIGAIIDIAKERNVPVVVDPKAHDLAVYAGATVLTPNLPELNRAALYARVTGDSVEETAWELMTGVDNILVTRGKEGMTLVTRQGEVTHIPASAREVYDVTGAGDTVVAVLALGMAAGLPLAKAARVANAAAGVVVGKIGTATVSPEELKKVLDELTR